MKPSDAVLLTIIIILVVLFATSRSHHGRHFGHRRAKGQHGGATDTFCQGQRRAEGHNACVECQ